MPVTGTQVPILSQFLFAVWGTRNMDAQAPPPPPENDRSSSNNNVKNDEQTPKPLPKGVVIGKDGKP